MPSSSTLRKRGTVVPDHLGSPGVLNGEITCVCSCAVSSGSADKPVHVKLHVSSTHDVCEHPLQRRKFHRLYEVCGEARFPCPLAVRFHSVAGDCHEAHRVTWTVGADLPCDLEAIEFGQPDVDRRRRLRPQISRRNSPAGISDWRRLSVGLSLKPY